MRRVIDWMEQAKGEFKAARDLYTTGNYAICCFMCQQATEKALKAILEHCGSPSHGHNLLALANEISRYVKVPRRVVTACRKLNRYYIPTRYPNAFPSGAPIYMYDSSDAEEALRLAEEVINFARKVTGIT